LLDYMLRRNTGRNDLMQKRANERFS